jgi:hypothetical protein
MGSEPEAASKGTKAPKEDQGKKKRKGPITLADVCNLGRNTKNDFIQIVT